MMTRASYNDIEIGASIATITSQIGEPYAVHIRGQTKEYEYIERINVGTNLVAENHYFIVFQNDKVIGKHMKHEETPAYDLIYETDPNYPSYKSYPP